MDVSVARRRRLPLGAVDRSLAAWVVLLGVAFVCGVAVRAWILRSRLGTVDSDEAIFGLMTKDLLRGDADVFFWLSYYAGTQEVFLTAPLFAVFGASVLALKIVPVALYAATAAITWRIGARTIGEAPGRLAAALVWVWPPFFVFWTTKRTSYPVALLCGTAVVLLSLRLRDRPARIDAILLGAAAGCGLWATPSSLLLSGPAIAWLALRRPNAVVRLAPWAILGGAAGSAPWLAWNVTHGFKALLPVESVAGAESSYLDRLADLFRVVLPEWLGLRLVYTQEWLVPSVIGAILTATALAGVIAVAAFARRELGPLVAILLAFPFLYAASSFTYFTDDPRYLVFLAPVGALLLARVAASLPLAAVAVTVAIGSTGAYLHRLESSGTVPFIGQPAAIEPLIRELDRNGVDHVRADYWIAYRLTFETDERIVATSTGFVRDARYDAAVRADRRAARVFVAGSAADRRAVSQLSGYRRSVADGWAVYVRR